MKTTMTLRLLMATAASSLLSGTVVISASAQETPEEVTVQTVIAPPECEALETPRLAPGINLGPLFQRAV